MVADKFMVKKLGKGHPRSGSYMICARYSDDHVSMCVPIQRLLGSQGEVAQALADQLNLAYRAWRQQDAAA